MGDEALPSLPAQEAAWLSPPWCPAAPEGGRGAAGGPGTGSLGGSRSDRQLQSGQPDRSPRGARRLLPGIPRLRAALAFVCSPAVCGVPSPPCPPQAPATTLSFHPDSGLQVAASLTPGRRATSKHLRASGGERLPSLLGLLGPPKFGAQLTTPLTCEVRKRSHSRSDVAGWGRTGRRSAFPEASPRLLLSPRSQPSWTSPLPQSAVVSRPRGSRVSAVHQDLLLRAFSPDP